MMSRLAAVVPEGGLCCCKDMLSSKLLHAAVEEAGQARALRSSQASYDELGWTVVRCE
jgi:hypothetical protein